LDWASVLSKLDSNTPKITHFGPEKSYLRTRLRDFWPKKSYSRTRKSEIFALKNPIFRTILGWSFTGPRTILLLRMPGARPGLTARVQSCHTGFSFYTFSQEAFLTGLDWLCGDIYCTITTKGSLFLEFSLTEMADKFSFDGDF
jgi:hypothetical protein